LPRSKAIHTRLINSCVGHKALGCKHNFVIAVKVEILWNHQILRNSDEHTFQALEIEQIGSWKGKLRRGDAYTSGAYQNLRHRREFCQAVIFSGGARYAHMVAHCHIQRSCINEQTFWGIWVIIGRDALHKEAIARAGDVGIGLIIRDHYAFGGDGLAREWRAHAVPLDGWDGSIGVAAGVSYIEAESVICRHRIGRIFGIVIGYLIGIDGYGAALAAGEVRIRIERVYWVGVCHHCGVCAGNGAGNTKPAFGDHHGFAEGNHDITVFSERATISRGCAGDSRGKLRRNISLIRLSWGIDCLTYNRCTSITWDAV